MRLVSRLAYSGSCLFLALACGGGGSGSGGGEAGSPNGNGGSGAGTTSNAGGVSNANGGASSSAGSSSLAGSSVAGATSLAGATSGGSLGANGGATATGGTPSSGGTTSHGGSTAGGSTSAGGQSSNGGASGCTGPVGTLSGALVTGINFLDTDGQRVDAHGGGIIKVLDTFYLHGEYFSPTTTNNDFNGFSMYSSKDMATWKNEGIILPQQPSGELGPQRKGERPHIIKCPSTGEFVLYAHAASEDYQTDKEIVYATSATVNGKYSYKGPLKDAGGNTAAHSDMTAMTDGNNAYVMTESGHVYTLATDCHSWLSDKTYGAVNGNSGGSESPTVFKAGSTYYWIGSNKTGWRANNNFYSTAPAITGPWTYQGFVAPVTDANDVLSDQRTWLTQSTWVMPVAGCNGTTYVYWGDHWDGNLDTTAPGKHNNLATFVFQPLVFNGIKISMPVYEATWKLDVGAGTWSQ
jgi:Glycosyl hydrolases family 43